MVKQGVTAWDTVGLEFVHGGKFVEKKLECSTSIKFTFISGAGAEMVTRGTQAANA